MIHLSWVPLFSIPGWREHLPDIGTLVPFRSGCSGTSFFSRPCRRSGTSRVRLRLPPGHGGPQRSGMKCASGVCERPGRMGIVRRGMVVDRRGVGMSGTRSVPGAGASLEASRVRLKELLRERIGTTGGWFPLTHGQEALWFLWKLVPRAGPTTSHSRWACAAISTSRRSAARGKRCPTATSACGWSSARKRAGSTSAP